MFQVLYSSVVYITIPEIILERVCLKANPTPIVIHHIKSPISIPTTLKDIYIDIKLIQ
jgi:hypothetical protein